MRKRKPRPGVCGVCGRAVVRPTDSQVVEWITNACTYRHTPTTVTVQGHEFDLDQRLLKVRCINHMPDPSWS